MSGKRSGSRTTRKLTAEGQRLVSEGSYLLKTPNCHFFEGGVGIQLLMLSPNLLTRIFATQSERVHHSFPSETNKLLSPSTSSKIFFYLTYLIKTWKATFLAHAVQKCEYRVHAYSNGTSGQPFGNKSADWMDISLASLWLGSMIYMSESRHAMFNQTPGALDWIGILLTPENSLRIAPAWSIESHQSRKPEIKSVWVPHGYWTPLHPWMRF